MNALTTTNEPTAERGTDALFQAIRRLGEAVQARIIGVPHEAAHQLEQAAELLSVADAAARAWDDAELAAAAGRARAVLAALRGVS